MAINGIATLGDGSHETNRSTREDTKAFINHGREIR